MAKGKKDKPTRKERRAQKRQVLLGGDEGLDLDAQLKRFGLTTKCITGDGNCLFRALSDQYYGYDKHHRLIRREICDYLGQNKETYQYFVEDDIPFDQYLSSMQQDGCFGGHMVIVGFARLRQVNVKIYQPGMIYVINGVEDEEDEEDTDRQVLHIAYHSWEHYSSIRNIDGPYNGMPEINDKDNIPKETETDAPIDDDDEEDSPDSKEKVILNACPGTNIRKVRRLLRKYKGDPDKVIDALYESDNNAIDDSNGNRQETSNTIANPIDDTVGTTQETLITSTVDDTKTEKSLTKNNNDASEVQKDEKQQPNDDDPIEQSQPNDNTKDPSTPPPPKRLTAQEKKLQKKMKQKELQREKKQQSANKRAAKTATKSTPKDEEEARQAMIQLQI